MAEAQIPYCCEGQQVEASILEAGGYNQVGAPLPLEAPYRTGTLEAVYELGIVVSLPYLTEYPVEDEEPISTFYPWSWVVSIRPTDAA